MSNFPEEPQVDTCDDQEGLVGKTMDSWESPLYASN